MPPKRSTRSGSAAKKTPAKAARTPAASKVTKKPSKRAATPSRQPTRASARLRASSAGPSESVAESSVAGSQGGSSEHETAVETLEQETAIQTIEEEEDAGDDEMEEAHEAQDQDQDQDGMLPSGKLERVLQSSPSILNQLTKAAKQDLLLSMRAEILRLRKTVGEMQQQKAATPSPELVRKHLERSRDLRFQFTIAQPAAAQQQLQAAVMAKSPEAEHSQNQSQAQESLQRIRSSVSPPAPAAAAPQSPQSPAASSPSPNASAAKPRTPPAASSSSSNNNTTSLWAVEAPSTQPQTPVAPISASPWGLRTMFSSAIKRAFGHGSTPQSQQQQQQQTQSSQSELEASSQQYSQTSPSEPQTQKRLNLTQSSPFSPSMTSMTPSIPVTPSVRSQHRRQQHLSQAQPQSPTPAQTPADTPSRRRGSMPGLAHRTPRSSAATPRRKPRPVEPNADKRAQILEQAAESNRLQEEQAAERKRIQEQASMLEEQKRIAEQEQKKLDDDDTAAQQIGSKRKRVRVDDLKAIPARLPGQSSGTFSFRPEFFEYDSDSDGDDYVEMDADEADELVVSRPAKKMRMEDNVFQSVTPQKPAPSPAASASAPSTPMPSFSQQQQTAVEQQRLRTSQHKPKKPSGLRQVSSISPATSGQTPQQISAATPAPSYYNTPAALTDITEITEPAETPAFTARAPFTPAPMPATPAAAVIPAAAATAPARAPDSAPATYNPDSPSDNPFGFPSSVPFWVSMPEIFTKEICDRALAVPLTEEEIEAATERFAVGCAEYIRREQAGEISTAIPAA